MTLIEKYGKELIEGNPEILNTRKKGIIMDYSFFTLDVLKEILDDVNIINISDYTYYIKRKEHMCRDEMNWHIDDAIIVKIPDEKQNENDLTSSTQIAYPDPINQPKYTLIIYENTQDVDFTGGSFSFVNEVIHPKKGRYIFFDSKEPRKLEQITSGTIHSILIKFYC